MKKYKIIIVVILFFLIIFLVNRLLTGKKHDLKYEESVVKVKSGDISVSVNVTGIVMPLKIKEIKSGARGKIINVFVREGDYLEKGALIAEVEKTFTKAVVAQCSVELFAAKAGLEKTKTAFEFEKVRNQQLVKNAEDNLGKAKLELQKAIEKEKMKIALKKNNIETESLLIKQEVDLRFTINEIQEKINITSKKEPVLKEFESLKASLKSAKSEYELVLDYLELTKKPIVEEKIDVEKFGIKQAELEYVKVKENIKVHEDAREKELIAAESEVSKKQEALKLAEDNLKDTIVTAPIAGTILQINFEKGQMISSKMLINSLGAVIATIADLSKVYIKAEVNKKDIGNLKKGQRIKMATDVFPKNTFEAIVTRIIQKKVSEKNTEVYEIKVEIENLNTLLKPDMNMTFKII